MKLIQIPLGAFASLRGYLPEPGGPAVPAILIAPGGGFRVCARREGEPVALAFLAEGYAAFVLDYTTLDKKPDAVMADPMADCAEALRTLRERGEALGLQKGRLALLGFSAGGHLAATDRSARTSCCWATPASSTANGGPWNARTSRSGRTGGRRPPSYFPPGTIRWSPRRIPWPSSGPWRPRGSNTSCTSSGMGATPFPWARP